AAERMVEMIGDADLEMQMLEGFRLYPAMVGLRFHRWDALLAAEEPSVERPFSRAFWRYARAMAYAGRGDVDKAEAEKRHFERDREAVPEEARYLLNNDAADLLALASATLDAAIAEARGDHEGAIAAWRAAVELERVVQYRRAAGVVLSDPPVARCRAARGGSSGRGRGRVPCGARAVSSRRTIAVRIDAEPTRRATRNRGLARRGAVRRRMGGRHRAAYAPSPLSECGRSRPSRGRSPRREPAVPPSRAPWRRDRRSARASARGGRDPRTRR